MSVERARSLILKKVFIQKISYVSLEKSLAFTLAKNLIAKESLPPWNNSAVDGFAVQSQDLKKASNSRSKALRRVETVYAGDSKIQRLKSGETIQIMTGAPLPLGADAVVIQEEVETSRNTVFFKRRAHSYQNVRKVGEDVLKGEVLLSAGASLNASRVGLLASCGVIKAPVFLKPKVSLFSTGSELLKHSSPLTPGHIRDSNGWVLKSLLVQMGLNATVFPSVPDHPDHLERALTLAFQSSDTVIVSGGVSVGEKDYVQSILRKMGAKIYIWKVAIKPGKPFLFALLGKKAFFGLPGNPVSAFVTFKLFVEPALSKMAGHSVGESVKIEARLREKIESKLNRKTYFKGNYSFKDGKPWVRLLLGQGSHQLKALAHANCFVVLGPGIVRCKRGSLVPILLLDNHPTLC